MKRLTEFTRKPSTQELATFVVHSLNELALTRPWCPEHEAAYRSNVLEARNLARDLLAEMLAEENEWEYKVPFKVKLVRLKHKYFPKRSTKARSK
jgi:hypothetical protein